MSFLFELFMFIQRIGYLAASQCFHEGTDVLMLTTNMIRKVIDQFAEFVSNFIENVFQDLNSSSMYEAGLAMSGLSCFINADLARDLANDIMSLVRRKNIDVWSDRYERTSFSCRQRNRTFGKEQFCFCIKYF